ncbi:hypothetical protein C0993_011872 [Termitomyces sp. T159_Od127]|nr:hypothetical protein C0993_011872 [Termitomyces sp. T159_Od127]
MTGHIKFIKHAEETMTLVRTITAAGVNFAARLPTLKYLPNCLAPHQHVARGRAMIDYFLTMPFEYVKQSMEKGTASPSLVKDLLLQENGDDPVTYEDRVKLVAGTNYSGTSCISIPSNLPIRDTHCYPVISETIYAAVLTFFLAMALHPDKQKHAQEELDRVIGADRVPTMTDQVSCLYVSALIQEVMRWYPTWSLGTPEIRDNSDYIPTH